MVFQYIQSPCGLIWIFDLSRERVYCVSTTTDLGFGTARGPVIFVAWSPGLVLTFIMLLIWLLPSDSTCSFTRASRESILEIRLLDKLRSSRLTKVSRPSMASMLLKDKSAKEKDSERSEDALLG